MACDYLVVYDIADGRRLARVARALLDYGARVQNSVFEIRLDDEGLPRLQKRLLRLIDPAADMVKIFRLCAACRTRRCGFGQERHLAEDAPWQVI